MRNKLYLFKLAPLVIIIGTMIYFLISGGLHSFSPIAIKNAIKSYGAWAPVIFTIAYALRTLTMFPPSIFSAAAGLAFGPLIGGICIYIGVVLSCLIGYFTGRLLGRDFMEHILGDNLEKFDKFIAESGPDVVFYVRFFAPLDPVSYAAGISKIPFGKYLISSTIPVFPGVVAYSFFGDSLTKIKHFSDVLTPPVYLPVLSMLCIATLPLLIRKIVKNKKKASK